MSVEVPHHKAAAVHVDHDRVRFNTVWFVQARPDRSTSEVKCQVSCRHAQRFFAAYEKRFGAEGSTTIVVAHRPRRRFTILPGLAQVRFERRMDHRPTLGIQTEFPKPSSRALAARICATGGRRPW